MTITILIDNSKIAAPATPAKRKFYEAPMVTLLVGKSESPFYVHHDLLCDASPVFKAAFQGNFKESSEKTMRLPEDDEATFKLLVDWLYSQRYEMLPEEDDSDDDNDDEDDDDEVKDDDDDDDDDDEVKDDDGEMGNDRKRFSQAFRLFVLAEKYEVLELKKLVIETLVTHGRVCSWGPAPSSISYAYENTTPGSGLRKMMVDWHVWRMNFEWFQRPTTQKFLQQQPDVAIDLIISFAKRLDGTQSDPFNGEVPEEYFDKKARQ